MDKASDFLGLKARLHESRGEFAQALDAIKRQQAIDSELLNRRRIETLAMMQGTADLSRATQQVASLEQQQALKEAELQNQRARTYIWIGALSALSIIAILIQGRLSQRRANRRLSRTVAERTAALRQSQAELERAYGDVREASLTDPLTGLRNRRFADENLDREVADANQHGHDLIFFLLDVDHFKGVNDEYGHTTGDLVLTEVGTVLRSVFDDNDCLIRWGGEEFLVVARGLTWAAATVRSETLRNAFALHRFRTESDDELSLTCSIGLSALNFSSREDVPADWQLAVSVADGCLYAAKAAGRNAWVGVPAAVELIDGDGLATIAAHASAVSSHDLTSFDP